MAGNFGKCFVVSVSQETKHEKSRENSEKNSRAEIREIREPFVLHLSDLTVFLGLFENRHGVNGVGREGVERFFTRFNQIPWNPTKIPVKIRSKSLEIMCFQRGTGTRRTPTELKK